LDIIPAYSQYLTGRMCFIFENESERLFLYDVPRQSDTFLLDGKALDVEYIQHFENSFRYITMRKINTKKLARGLHCLESKGRYLLFIFGGSEKMYGYAPAFNTYAMETSKWIVENNFHSYRYDIFGTSFMTLFPWITIEDNNDDSATVLTLEILNPHPYMVAEVNISYLSEIKGNLIEKTYNIIPYTHRKLEINEKMVTKLYAAYSDTIYKSNHDSRIAIKSSMPVSVTQSCFFDGEIGESFVVLPLRMADQKYSFLLPKSIANNSHITIYFLPSNQTTKISIVAKFDGKERFHEIEAKAEKNSSIFAYYGFAKELSLNLLGDNPFQVIIIIQQLLFANNTLSINSRADFGCEMGIPSVQNGIGYTNISKSQKSTSNLTVDSLHLNQRICNIIFNYLGELLTFSQRFIAAQYVTGRSHFAVHHYRNLIIVFMDKNAVNDLEIDGVFAADDIYELQTPYDCTYFTFKFLLPTVPIHYVQSSGRYVVYIKSDVLQNNFHQYFVAFGTQMNMNKEIVSTTEVTNRKPFTERVEVMKSYLKIWNRKVLTKQVQLESTLKQLFTTDQIGTDKQTESTSGSSVSLARTDCAIITGLQLIILIKIT
uniref:Transmembrane protein n=1 Tax=Brugia timori TaxID=42155 RepID=A0A0R3QMK4_9BILA